MPRRSSSPLHQEAVPALPRQGRLHHLQHVLTAIAVNIERLSQLPPGEKPAPRPPTAFQDYLDQHDIQRLRPWRAVS